jgi:hypothetical protein
VNRLRVSLQAFQLANYSVLGLVVFGLDIGVDTNHIETLPWDRIDFPEPGCIGDWALGMVTRYLNQILQQVA